MGRLLVAYVNSFSGENRIEARVEERLRGHFFPRDLSGDSFWSQDPFIHLEITEEHRELLVYVGYLF